MSTTAEGCTGASRQLRVLVVTPWYPVPSDPAWGVFVREHARAAALHCEVAVLHSLGPWHETTGLWQLETEEDQTLTAGLPTYRLRTRLTPFGILTSLLYMLGLIKAIIDLRRDGFRLDVLHAHGYDPGFAAVLAGRLLRVPVVITEHYSAFPLGTLSRRQLRRARATFRWADAVLPVSRTLSESIRGLGLEGRFEVVTNTVDTDLFHPPPRSAGRSNVHRFLFVGRLHPIKGLPTLLSAAAAMPRLSEFSDREGEWRLDILGDGPARREYEQMAASLGIAERVVFHGTRDKAAVAEFMRMADALILPSRWENAPCVVIEALASGTPVIASDVGGIPELVDRLVGELVPPESVEDLAAALGRSLRGYLSHDRAAIVERGRSYGFETVGVKLHTIYRRVATE